MNNIGFERFRIQLIINYQCEDKYQLRQKEGEYIWQTGTLNKNIAGRTNKEYYENNKDKINEKKKEIIKCDCGCEIRKHNLKRHQRNKKHQQLMEQIL